MVLSVWLWVSEALLKQNPAQHKLVEAHRKKTAEEQSKSCSILAVVVGLAVAATQMIATDPHIRDMWGSASGIAIEEGFIEDKEWIPGHSSKHSARTVAEKRMEPSAFLRTQAFLDQADKDKNGVVARQEYVLTSVG